ncbi:hypothetical protein DW082_13240 [Alistipes sp. AF48-12]|nr:hypothetical protein DW082_13240 [Alistipes sp. AF48-12]
MQLHASLFEVLPVLKNATPEQKEFRFNPLNRNVLVKPKPNLLTLDACREIRSIKEIQPFWIGLQNGQLADKASGDQA